MQDTDDKKVVYKDTRNNIYTRKETDSLAPTLYYRQLITENRFPDTLFGVAVTPQLIKRTNFFFRQSPRDINAAHIALYPLLESRPKRVDLSMPDDVCRFTDKEIQFIDMETNTVKKEKSARFQRVLDRKGVSLPVKTIAGNPTTRKEYDEGYFFTDSKNQFFHLKQMAGNPYVRKIETAPDMVISHIFVTEFPNRSSFAFLTDAHNQLYVLTAPGYTLIKTALPAYNPEKDDLLIMGNMFDWNVRISNASGMHNYALNVPDYTLRDTLSTPLKTTKWEKASTFIFPFELKFTSRLNKYFAPRIVNFSQHALFLHIIWVALFVFLSRKDKKQSRIVPSLSILIAGLFAFIPLLLFRVY